MANGVGIAVPSQQLNLVDSLSTPYGLKELPPSLALKQQNINRRQHLANILLQRGIQPLQGQQAGRFYVPPHWSQGVSQLAQAGLGAYMTYKGSKDTEALGQENKDIIAAIDERYDDERRKLKVPEVPPSQLTPTPADAQAPQTPAPQQGPPPEALAEMRRLLASPPDQSNLPQTIPNDINFGQGEGPARHPMTGAPLTDNATPPIATPYQMPGLQPPAPGDPNAQVAQAIAPPQQAPPAMPPPAMQGPMRGPMQGPLSPGTPAREPSFEEKANLIRKIYLMSEHPQAQETGKMLLNQMQQTENMGALRDERVENRQTLHEEKLASLAANTDMKKQLTAIQQQQFEMTNQNAQRSLDQQHEANISKLKEGQLDRAQRERIEADNNRIDRERLALDRSKAEKGAGGKALPGSIGGKFMENSQNLRMAERAKGLIEGQTVEGVKGDKNATGMKGYLPDAITQRTDPSGVETRAAVANLGSMIIHDRSGAAVTASEYPRLKPFIPAATDDPATVKKKLGQFINEYGKINDEMTQFYTESGYNVPEAGWHKSPEVAPPATPGPTSAGPVPHAPYEDPADERAYQEYKKRERDKFLKEHH